MGILILIFLQKSIIKKKKKIDNEMYNIGTNV